MHRHLRVAVLPPAAEEVPGDERPRGLRDVARTDLRREVSRRRSALPA
jgi:hypothetical protein